MTDLHQVSRRMFLGTAAAFTTGWSGVRACLAQSNRRLQLGIDNFAVRAMNWKAEALIDYADQLNVDSLFITDLDAFENHTDEYLRRVRAYAEEKSIRLFVGTWSICPTSESFKNNWGSADEHLSLGIRIAKTLRSPVLRVVLGSNRDRLTQGGIQARIADTVEVLRRARRNALDSGVKIAVENHAGDMQSHELVGLIEAAGKGYVGANIDPGNAVWALEEPLKHLEVLGPLTVCSSVRDSMLWEDESGAVMVQWTAIGDGLVDYKLYAKRFAELAPGVPLQVETISGFARPFDYQKEEFWKIFPNHRDSDMFKAWLGMAKRGHKIDSFKAPDGPGKKDAEIAYQKGQVERSFDWLRANA
ncbi:MAG: TIM barrel protein [Planctomycetales bacterium]|nr:TIM barrel protein [Planctomycetales bacterium]